MNFGEQVIRALGIDPVQAREAVNRLLADCGAIKAGVLGAREGFANACLTLKASQDRIEARQLAMERALVQLAAAISQRAEVKVTEALLPAGVGEAAPANPPNLANGATPQ